MADYAHPECLISTEWVAGHAGDANVRLVEVDVDTSAYEQGHIAGAVGWNWQSQLQQSVRRDVISKEEMERLLGNAGVDNNTTVVLYGDNNNWFAAWAFWQLKYYGHDDVRLMNGGRAKWVAENRPLTTDEATPAANGVPFTERLWLWCVWWARVIFVYLPYRIFVLVGDSTQHDLHHRHPLSDWANAKYVRYADAMNGDTEKYGQYSDEWGTIIDHLNACISEWDPTKAAVAPRMQTAAS